MSAQLRWGETTESDLGDVVALAQACLELDGGLPMLGRPGMARARLLGGQTTGARSAAGDLVAVASLRTVPGTLPVTVGLVHPEWRGQGIGTRLLDWAASTAGGDFKVLSETVTEQAERLYTARGLTRTFAEYLMRHALDPLPRVAAPEGIRLLPFDETSAVSFHAAYRGSFAHRPGIPDPTLQEWAGELLEDHEVRRDLSVVAMAGDEPVGFIIVLTEWVDQVGVLPSWRGRALAAHLMARALAGLAARDVRAAWLNVEIENPGARALHLRLGFADHGMRAWYGPVG